MNRQQEVLRALRRELDPCTLVPRIPELLAFSEPLRSANLPRVDLLGTGR